VEADDIKNLRAPRGSKFIHAGGKGMSVRTDGERVVDSPDGKAKVTTDASGVVTQITEGDRLHAVVRPKGYKFSLKKDQ
jgi:hypothetical protein